MLGLSYGELFLILGATAALIGPKDLPRIARVAGRLAGRSIGYVQMARGQFDNVMQQTQAKQVHKELQDALAQMDAIRHEMRAISFVNPGPLTRTLMDNVGQTPETRGSIGTLILKNRVMMHQRQQPLPLRFIVQLPQPPCPHQICTDKLLLMRAEAQGSDIMLESILQAEVARNAKDFFAQPQNLNIK
ncbi:hypothetical protein Ccrd_009178 [Cynara cardunculus var. scolymus]|uniref:Sec-independent protein translocase protein TatB n=1 Tax=Cynara cardunculus var. scolymus TaxID=59895 RepID=A0A118K7L4_CYNCS|nr:hypothetical protein Ccrd_009178 [Cynara cardunculus var. scolymus]